MPVTQAEIKAACTAYDANNGDTQWDDMKAALEAAERARWQPIETARDTDERILVIGGRYEIPTIVLSDANWWRHAKLKSTPSHWQPLPSPPESADASD
jgi:hypothetical protein